MANADWLTYERFVTVGRILGVLLFSTMAGLDLYMAVSDPNPPLFFGVNLHYLDAIPWLFFAILFLKDLVGFTIFERHR